RDAALAVARSAIVRRHEPIETDRSNAASRELIQRGAPHGAEANDDDVCGVIVHRTGGATLKSRGCGSTLVHTKLLAWFVLPEPVHLACCGYGQSGRLMVVPFAVREARSVVGATPCSTQLTTAS